MKRKDHSATIGLIASLLVHGAIVGAVLRDYVRQTHARRGWRAVAERAKADEIYFRDGDFGESVGRGEAMNSLEGLEPFVGRLGPQDQAPLSRDPVGNGSLADEPVVSEVKENLSPPMPESVAGDSGVSAPFGVGDVSKDVAPAVVGKLPLKMIAVEEKGALPSVATAAPHPDLSSPRRLSDAVHGGEGNSGTQAAASGGVMGDPAPMSESESDAFSRFGSIAVKNGRVEARLGRNFKSVKPRLSLKAELDAISIAKPIVEMKLSVDETGRVIDVKVLRSSGSNEIDLPTTAAMYKWWIEPAKDKQGKAMKDVILVTFSYL